MPEPFDLTTVIEDSISDAALPETEVSDVSEDTSFDASAADTTTEATEVPVGDVDTQTEGLDTSTAAASPAARQGLPQGDSPVDKKLGISSHTNGRENRIPYSRVKKIVEKAEKEALAPLQTKLAELEPKVADFETRLRSVAEFESVMVNDSPRFLGMLATLPAYQGFFTAIQELQNKVANQAQTTTQTVADDPMPAPDDTENGVYTLEGLQKLLDWQSRQVEQRVNTKVEERYAPLRQQYEQQQQANAERQHLETQVIPQVQKQIDEARKWPLFNDNEEEITKYLNQYPQSRLEEAYRVVVLPKIQSDRNSMREQVLNELKTAPQATSTTQTGRRPSPIVSTGPKNLEDVIRQQMQNAGLK